MNWDLVDGPKESLVQTFPGDLSLGDLQGCLYSRPSACSGVVSGLQAAKLKDARVLKVKCKMVWLLHIAHAYPMHTYNYL